MVPVTDIDRAKEFYGGRGSWSTTTRPSATRSVRAADAAGVGLLDRDRQRADRDAARVARQPPDGGGRRRRDVRRPHRAAGSTPRVSRTWRGAGSCASPTPTATGGRSRSCRTTRRPGSGGAGPVGRPGRDGARLSPSGPSRVARAELRRAWASPSGAPSIARNRSAAAARRRRALPSISTITPIAVRCPLRSILSVVAVPGWLARPEVDAPVLPSRISESMIAVVRWCSWAPPGRDRHRRQPC